MHGNCFGYRTQNDRRATKRAARKLLFVEIQGDLELKLRSGRKTGFQRPKPRRLGVSRAGRSDAGLLEPLWLQGGHGQRTVGEGDRVGSPTQLRMGSQRVQDRAVVAQLEAESVVVSQRLPRWEGDTCAVPHSGGGHDGTFRGIAVNRAAQIETDQLTYHGRLFVNKTRGKLLMHSRNSSFLFFSWCLVERKSQFRKIWNCDCTKYQKEKSSGRGHTCMARNERPMQAELQLHAHVFARPQYKFLCSAIISKPRLARKDFQWPEQFTGLSQFPVVRAVRYKERTSWPFGYASFALGASVDRWCRGVLPSRKIENDRVAVGMGCNDEGVHGERRWFPIVRYFCNSEGLLRGMWKNRHVHDGQLNFQSNVVLGVSAPDYRSFQLISSTSRPDTQSTKLTALRKARAGSSQHARKVFANPTCLRTRGGCDKTCDILPAIYAWVWSRQSANCFFFFFFFFTEH